MTQPHTIPLAPKENLRSFYHLLVNNLAVSITNFTVWFAITFFAYLKTESVFVTGMIAGLYLVAVALTGFWFGSLVDHHKKKTMMIISSIGSLLAYALSFAIYLATPIDMFKNIGEPALWLLIAFVMMGVILGNIRTIAMQTSVTILIPEDRRDKANGLVGTVFGTSMLVTSVISGVLVAWGDMLYVLILGLSVTAASIVHLLRIHMPEKGIVHAGPHKKIDVKGTFKIILGVPGLLALILFTTFNNFLGGVFMSLMDAYGLSLVSVEVWGFLWGFLSLGFIAGGMLIAKKGLGRNPLRTMLLLNIVLWGVSSLFTIQSSIILLTVGLLVYMVLMPYIEATEQTILQKVVPFERQGRVMGFAQSVEQTASPLTAFLIGPLTQFIFIPFMTVGTGAQLIGGWFGTGPERGIALVFTLAGLIGLFATLLALGSSYYRQLSQKYLEDAPSAPEQQR